jgi:hypothetical protein
MVTLLVAACFGAPTGLILDVVGEPHDCPLWRHMAGSLRRVAPSLRVGQTDSDSDLLLTVTTTTDGVSIQIENRLGRTVLRRGIPVRAEVCESSADIIALIVERYYRDVGWSPELTGLPQPPSDAATLISESDSEEWQGPHWLGRAVTEVAGSATQDLRLGGSLAAQLSRGPWDLTLALGALSPTRREVRRDDVRIGTLSVWSVDAVLALSRCAYFGSEAVCLGLGAGAEALFGDATGRGVFREHQAALVQSLFDIDARVTHSFTNLPISFTFSAGLRLRPGEAGFAVEAGTPEYQSPWIALRLALGLAWDPAGRR